MTEKGRILIVDDEVHQRRVLLEAVQSFGHEADEAENGNRALELLRFGHYDILLTDLQMPGMDGLRLLENVRIFDPTVSVILLTAHGSIDTAVDAMKKGATDYLQKPVELSALELLLTRVFEMRKLLRRNQELQSENEDLKSQLGIRFHVIDSIGRSAKATELHAQIQKKIGTRTPVLIAGESGTGKDEVARMIHYNGPWSAHSLIFFDCAHVPEELHEQQLFGEETRIENGVKRPSRPGIAERAHQGTLVIANIDRLAKRCQPSLSRVLREEKTQRTGGARFYPASVRIIATTVQSIDSIAQLKETLRWDLYDLLYENRLSIPALRERREDIPVLTVALTQRSAGLLGKKITRIEKDITLRLQRYDFPGNLRELASIVEAAVIRCRGEELKLEHFASPMSAPTGNPSLTP